MKAVALIAAICLGILGVCEARAEDAPAHRMEHVTIWEWGPAPPPSGIFHTRRRVTGADNQHHLQDFWITWLGEGQAMPQIGQTCTMRYTTGPMEWNEEPERLAKDEPMLLERFFCRYTFTSSATATLSDILVVEWGPPPATSSYFETTMRRITVAAPDGAHHDLWVAWTGSDHDMPSTGQHCSVRYHVGPLAKTVEKKSPLSLDNKILDDFACRPAG